MVKSEGGGDDDSSWEWGGLKGVEIKMEWSVDGFGV